MGALFRLSCLWVLVFAAGKPRQPPGEAGPPLRTGDVVLQASPSSRAELIQRASRSPYSHVGLVEVAPDGAYVVEAVQPVSRTPWKAWRARGRGGKVTVLRAQALSPQVLRRVVDVAKSWLGRPYDARYRWDDASLYCSELVAKAFERGAGAAVGAKEKVRDLALTPAELAQAARLGVGADLELVTPGSVVRDAQLSVVWTDF